VRVPADVARRVRDGHPFIFAEALRGRVLSLPSGHAVEVVDPDGKFVAVALHDAEGNPPLRVISRRPGAGFGEVEVMARVQACVALRRQLLDMGPQACCRVISGDSEGLPAMNVDRFGDYLVVALTSAVAETFLPAVLAGLARALQPAGIYLQRRFQAAVPGRPRPGAELVAGAAAPTDVIVAEGRARFVVDVSSPGGTGVYPDMRNGRRVVAEHSGGRRVLNCFSYTGAFSTVAALGGAASVVSVDAAARAHGRARRNFAENGLDAGDARYEFITGDTFATLARFAERRRQFDLCILDPPTFSAAKGGPTFTALKDYAELVAAAAQVAAPGALLLAASNAAKLPAADLERAVGRGASLAGREAVILEQLGQPLDYPVLPSFPEGAYLKIFLASVS
jgi:23S rRNA (cytosine1962-C5)-methyltransferase